MPTTPSTVQLLPAIRSHLWRIFSSLTQQLKKNQIVTFVPLQRAGSCHELDEERVEISNNTGVALLWRTQEVDTYASNVHIYFVLLSQIWTLLKYNLDSVYNSTPTRGSDMEPRNTSFFRSYSLPFSDVLYDYSNVLLCALSRKPSDGSLSM